jgi:hypothetical protein
MEYITSRGYKLPTDQSEMENSDWFNMWGKKNFPYKELLVGDILYWYESLTQKLVWKTQIVAINRFPYNNKQEVFSRFPNAYTSKYHESRPDKGYFIGYKFKVLEKINLDKPKGSDFPQLGWLKVNNDIALTWFNRQSIDDTNTLDDNISNDIKSLKELLDELNEKMQNVSPERVEKLITATIRQDTKIIQAFKKASDYKCQFPNCGQRIKKKNGGYYIEVAHIKPVYKGGKSVLGNLIVLCPNHHKEFDFGELEIRDQTISNIAGQLNGIEFQISL